MRCWGPRRGKTANGWEFVLTGNDGGRVVADISSIMLGKTEFTWHMFIRLYLKLSSMPPKKRLVLSIIKLVQVGKT